MTKIRVREITDPNELDTVKVPTLEAIQDLKLKFLRILNEYEKGYITLEEQRNKLIDLIARYLKSAEKEVS